MPVYVKFISLPHEKESQEFGPFDSVQLTYEVIRTNFGDTTMEIGYINSRGWWVIGQALVVSTVDQNMWSDVLIYSK